MTLRHISEVRQLLEGLILSSESFNYPKAKLALAELERKIRELARVEARLREERHSATPLNVVRFPRQT